MKGKATVLAVLLSTCAGTAGAQTLEQIEAYERRIDEQQRQLDAMREELEALKKMAGVQTADIEQREPTSASIVNVVDEEVRPGSFVVSRSGNSVLTLGGRVHRVMMQVDDGASDVPPLSVAAGFRVLRHCNSHWCQRPRVLGGRQPVQ